MGTPSPDSFVYQNGRSCPHPDHAVGPARCRCNGCCSTADVFDFAQSAGIRGVKDFGNTRTLAFSAASAVPRGVLASSMYIKGRVSDDG